MKPVPALRLATPVLAALTLAQVPVFGDFTFYGVRFPSTGPRTSGVIRTSLPDFPWLVARNVRTPDDLARLIDPRGEKTAAEKTTGETSPVRRPPVKPAIFYLSKQAVKVGKSNLARSDAHFFLQEDVARRMKDYRWYWTYVHSVAGRLLVARYGLKSAATLVIFEADGSILHVETPIDGPESVARAMRIIDYKRQMAEALKADLPGLRNEFREGNIKPLVKYLQHADKHIMYASQWTLEKVAAIRRAVNHHGERQIKAAEELAASGERSEALKMLGDIKREYEPLSVATEAENAAKKIRSGRS